MAVPRPWLWMYGNLVIYLGVRAASMEQLAGLPRLYRNLTENYTKMRPRVNASQSVKVAVAFYINSILDLDSRNGALRLHGDFIHVWNDEYLVWDPSQFDDIRDMTLYAEDLWLPDLGIFNSMSHSPGDAYQSMKEFPGQVMSDGTVFWGYTTLVECSCSVDMRFFPFDTQSCFIHYATRTSYSWLVDMEPMFAHVQRDFYVENGQFEIVLNSSYYKLLETEGSPLTYPSLIFLFHIKRRPAYYVLNMILPCFSMSLLGLLAFCMPVEAGERVSLQVTMLLSYGLFEMMLAEYIPNSSTSIPILSSLIVSVMLLSAVSLATNVLVLNVHNKHPNTKMSPMCHRIIFGVLGKMLSTQSPRSTYDMADRSDHHARENGCGAATTTNVRAVHNPELAVLRDILNVLKQLERRLSDVSQDSASEKTQWHMAAEILDRFFLVGFFLVFVSLGAYSLAFGL